MTLLIIDVGSSSVRALLMDETTEHIALARREHRFSRDPDHLRTLVESCIDEVLPRGHDITAVGMATFAGNFLGVDADNTPLTPLYTYADTDSGADAAALLQAYDLETVHARTGCRIHPAYHPATLHRLRRTHPDTVARVAHWPDVATYCYTTWFGRAVPCSYSIASWSGMLHRQALAWDSMWLAALGLTPAHLPALADFDAVQRGLSARYAERWPPLRDVPFYLAVGDGAAANIGAGGTSAKHPVLTIGTTAALRTITTTAENLSTGLWAYRVDAARHLVGGATNEGGNIFTWARETLRLDDDQIEHGLQKPREHGLTVLPLLAGERSPGYAVDATGTLHGLRLQTSPEDIVYALLEGVALRLRVIYDLMGRPGTAVLASGGALENSPAWAQLVADALGVPLHQVAAREATANGVARLITQSTTPPAIKTTISPRAEMAASIESLLARQQALYDRLVSAL